jgi:HPt (histidine-containing phosphotransfer) domain-containing protein
MLQADIDETILTAFLDLGGSEMRQALLAQVQSDLTRCGAALEELTQRGDMAGLCRAAHEIKGIAATIGATTLNDLAGQSEAACAHGDATLFARLQPELSDHTRITAETLSSLMQV